jgi:hypothetical protein
MGMYECENAARERQCGEEEGEEVASLVMMMRVEEMNGGS